MRRRVLGFAIACIAFFFSVLLTDALHALLDLNAADNAAVTNKRPPIQTFDQSSFRDERELFEVYEQYAEAQTNHDTAFFERVEADEFVLFGPNGTIMTRDEDIALMSSLPLGTKYTYDQLNVQLYGNGAVVTGRMTATFEGGYSHSSRWIDVCRKTNGHWQILSTTQLD